MRKEMETCEKVERNHPSYNTWNITASFWADLNVLSLQFILCKDATFLRNVDRNLNIALTLEFCEYYLGERKEVYHLIFIEDIVTQNVPKSIHSNMFCPWT